MLGFFAVNARMQSKAPKAMILLPLLSGFCVYSSTNWLVHACSWTIFIGSIPLAVKTTKKDSFGRLSAVCIALQSMYILLGVSYEGHFMLCLMASLGFWLYGEYADSFREEKVIFGCEVRERKVVDAKDIFRGLCFLFYSIVSFFGTGNVASLNSFDPKSIACLVSVFNPFLMAALLLFKVLLPFLTVACFVKVIQRVTGINSAALTLIVLLFSDVMSLHFFFMVTDRGSWQEIGTSLSHFVIAEATVIFLQILSLIAKFVLTF